MNISNRQLLRELFKQEILPNLKFIEKDRKNRLQKLLYEEIIAFTALIGAWFLGKYFLLNGNGEAITLCIAIFLGILAYIIYRPFNMDQTYREELKKQFFPVFLKKIHNIKWGINQYNINTTVLQKCGLFSNFQREHDDDTFKGCYKDVDFTISESRLCDLKVNWMSKGGGEYELKVFQGIIIAFDFIKKHKTTTIVTTKKDFNSKNNICVNITAVIMSIFFLFFYSTIFFTNSYENEPLPFSLYIAPVFICSYFIYYIYQQFHNKKIWDNKRITLEDPIWEKRFNVYSEDEVEARYLVTTAFMERFLNLNTAFGVNKAKCSFYKDQIIFAISTNKNLFEVGNLFTPTTEILGWYKFINELSSILDMIDYFKINEKTKL